MKKSIEQLKEGAKVGAGLLWIMVAIFVLSLGVTIPIILAGKVINILFPGALQ